MQSAPTPPPAPVLAGTPAPHAADFARVQTQGQNAPNEVYEAFRNQRRELRNQLEELQGERRSVTRQLQQPGIAAPDTRGLEQRLVGIDQRITALDKQIADADAAVAKAAAVPGAVIEVPPPDRGGPPEEVFMISGLFMIVVLLPISIAFARRIWRRGSAAVTALPQEFYDRLTRVEQSLDSIAIEVERVGEGQRFLTRMQSQRAEHALGAGPAERVELGNREMERQPRK